MKKLLLLLAFVLSTSTQSGIIDSIENFASHNPALAIAAGVGAVAVAEPLIISGIGLTIAPIMYAFTAAPEAVTVAEALATAGEVIPELSTGIRVISSESIIPAPAYAPVVFTTTMVVSTAVAAAGATGFLNGAIDWAINGDS